MTLSAVVILNLATFSQTTTFTYQGKLTDAGNPPTGTYQMEFRLFDAVAGGTRIGPIIPNDSVSVAQGIFSVRLDFGAEGFTGADRFLQISVRRNAGEGFVTLNPRQQITSSPYSIRTLSAAQADMALDSEKLGGIDASEYVNASTVAGTFIRNSTTQQTANFNVSGNGTLGGTLQASSVRAQTASGNYGLNHTDGTVSLSSYTGGSSSGASGGWFGTQSNHPLHLFTNNGQPRMTIDTAGNVGIGTFTPQTGVRLDVTGNSVFRTANGNVNLGSPNSETGITITNTNRADVRFNGTTLLMAAGTGTGVPGNTGIAVNTAGNVGIGTTTPNTRLSLIGGTPWTSAGWTASMNLQNVSALGWEANASGQRFGIGQTNGGLYFFRTNSGFGNSANLPIYDMTITDTGNITQPRDKHGLVKAMIYVAANGGINRCYNSITNSSTGGCGFIVNKYNTGWYVINFGFETFDRFYSVTTTDGQGANLETGTYGPTEAWILTFGSSSRVDTGFYVIVY